MLAMRHDAGRAIPADKRNCAWPSNPGTPGCNPCQVESLFNMTGQDFVSFPYLFGDFRCKLSSAFLAYLLCEGGVSEAQICDQCFLVVCTLA